MARKKRTTTRRRRTTGSNKINTKLIVDTIGASLIVQQAPGLINQVFPLAPELQAIAGGGAGFLAGKLLKRPDLSNISLALMVVDFISPMIGGFIGNPTQSQIPMGVKVAPGSGTGTIKSMPPVKIPLPAVGVDDYIHLNAYVPTPGVEMGYEQYYNTYQN